MSNCPIEIPQCKRKLMFSNRPYEKKQCPLNIKPRCALVPPACPLLPQDNPCGLSKIQDPNAPVDVSKCPAKSPCLLAAPGCPMSACGCAEMQESRSIAAYQEPRTSAPSLPAPCPVQLCSRKKQSNNDENKILPKKKKDVAIKVDSVEVKKPTPRVKGRQKCPMSSNMRPLPCSECILDELSVNDAGGDRGKVKACPFLKIADSCGPCCDCAEVSPIVVDPVCPFLPKPCPCCTAPRCPLSRKPDCALNPKPQCGLLKPPCCCGTNCLGEALGQCGPPKCPLSRPSCLCGTCIRSCLTPPRCICLCGLCPPGSSSCPLSPRCFCGGCPPGAICPLKAPKCLCGSCPLTIPKCLLSPCSCCSGPLSCLLNPSLCPLSPPKCPGLCCLQPPTCPGSCPLSAMPCPLTSSPSCPPCDPCPLLRKPICPPIPPPCTINKYELEPNPPKTTFHVPLCPQYKPPCKLHVQSTNGEGPVCPFSPHPCPLGPTCPFPVAVSEKQDCAQIIKKEEVGRNYYGETKEPVANDVCPGSSTCGVIPTADCPAAEVLCPDIYKKKKKEKKEECPFKECMRKPECPFNKAMPDVDCPMAGDSDCPLAKEPDCPVAELANKCPMSCCLCLPPPCPTSICLTQATCTINLNKNREQKSNQKSTCPLSKPVDCALSAITADCPLLPKMDCPLAPKPDCPLAPKPECPLAEFAPKSDCPAESARCPLAPQPKCQISGKSNPCPLANPPECVLTGLVPDQKPLSNSKADCPLFAPKPISGISNKKESESLNGVNKRSEKTNPCPIADPSDCILSKIKPSLTSPERVSMSETKRDGVSQGKRNTGVSKAGEPDCPLMDLIPKRNCPLAPPECPLTPKPACPLRKMPQPCPLSVSKDKPFCPVEYPPCAKFPEGRCPMTQLNLCDCDYPVSPCMLPPQIDHLSAPPQYCVKENCCMGLSLPPVAPKVNLSSDFLRTDDYFYKFVDTKPGKEETKHYVQVLKEPPTTRIGLFGEPKERLHKNWTIIKAGEGYKKCCSIVKKLEKMGPTENEPVQYKDSDCPIDLEVKRVMENRRMQKFEQNQVERLRQSLKEDRERHSR